MIKNNVYYEWFASITVPNPDQVGYWIDLGADSKGRIIKVYNHDIEKWIVLFDVSKDDYVPPFIGSNGNWWVDNRDTGVKATAETPYIGENDHWFTYDPINKVYVDTGIEARGLSAYDIAVKLGFKGSEQDWIDSLSKASEDAAIAALEAANKANEAADKANQAVEEIEGIVDDAIAATDKAEEIASNPPKIVDGDWWIYDYDTKQYVNTGIAAIGDAFTYKKEYPSVEAMEADWGTADVKLGEYVLINTNDVEDPDDAKVYLKTQEGWKFIVDLSGMQGIQGPQGEPGKDAELSKAAIEAVLVGEVTTHTHDTRYYTKDQTDANIKVVADDLANNYYNKSQVDSKFTSVYIFKGSVDSVEDLPTEGNVIGDVWNVRKNDTNYAWTSEGWDALGGTAELASLTSNGLMSKEDFAKLQGIEAGAQVNKIETITKRVLLNAVNKNVTIPEDIKISDTEPTEEEIMWLDPSENYDFTFDGYSQAQADARFVQKEEGKGLSTNDYTNADKTKVTNLTDYVTGGTGAVTDANAATITLSKKNPVNGSASTDTVVINKATTTTAGVMSAADKTKLDGLSNYDDSTITQDITNIKANKLETIEVTGTGNVITTVTKNGTKIAFAKGITAMTQDTSDARYVKKTGDTMSGRLNIKTPASTGFTLRLAKETSDTPENDEIFVRMDIDDNNKGSFGYHNTHGTSMYNYGSSSRFHIANDGELKYLTNGVDGKVWHAGNDGSGSGLDADLLDGYHAGYKNGDLALYINLPKITDLISQGLLRSDYKTVGYPTEDFLIALCKWAINNYTDETSHVLLQGEITPAVSGWCVLNLYANDGKDNATGLPKYCSGQVNLINKSSILFGSYNGTWYYKTLVDTSNLEDTLAYWYENNENASSTTCLTGGNRNVIESLRSKFKRCIAKPYGDDAALISYCNEENSANWPDGSAIDIDLSRKENRMVYFPKYYHKTVERSPGIWRTYISEQQIDSDYIEEPEMLLSTFEAYTNTDGTLMSVWGVASTASQTMATFISQAKSNGPLWSIGDYRSHATIARMFCAYYKTTNISTSNSAIPCSGGTKRYNYGVTGATITLGNRDGKKATTNDTSYYSTNFLGLEDCYYSKWEFVQGINILKGKYVVYDGGSFPDKDVAELEAAGATNIRVVGYEPNPAATEGYNGWTKAIAQGKYGDVVPTAHGGSETTYYSDYSWFNPTGNRIFLRSGRSDYGSRCGVFMAAAYHASSASWTNLGARLAFYGKIVVVDSDTFKKMQA